MSIVPTLEQKRIIESDSRRILVEANAGAAKTTTAALRIWKLIRGGASPSRICGFAFSKSGVEAYKQAFERIGMPGSIASKVRLGTVDDFCAARLKNLEGIVPERLTRPQEVKPYVLESIQEARALSDDKFPGAFSLQGSGVLAVESLLEDFSYLKGTLGIQRYGDYFRYDPATAVELGCDYTALAVFRQYEKVRNSFLPPDGWVPKFRYIGDATYDMAKHLLSGDPPWGETDHPLQLNLDAIVLDEMHDCGWAIFTVIQNLLERNPQSSFIGLGDRDQVIHGKHGADSYFMGPNLDAELGETARFPLTLTHRFGQELAQPLSHFSGKAYGASASKRTQLILRAVGSAKDNVAIINELANDGPTTDADSDGENLVVLLRHPGASVEIEHGLILKGVDYQTVGFTTFLQRPEIAFARMLLSIALDHESCFIPESLLEGKRAVWQFLGANLPGPTTADETGRIVESASESDFKSYVFPAMLREAEKKIIESVQTAFEIAASDKPQDVGRFLGVLRFSSLAANAFVSKKDIEEAIFSMESFAEVAKEYRSIGGMLQAMNTIDYQHRKTASNRRQIRLSTIEDAKGMEFRQVFIPDCNKSSFDGMDQDERNLFYVAASRARDRLVISYRKGAGSSYLKFFM